jgi:hypothetical protein
MPENEDKKQPWEELGFDSFEAYHKAQEEKIDGRRKRRLTVW